MTKCVSKEQWERRINDAAVGKYKFIDWEINGDFGWKSHAIIECFHCENKWSASPNNLIRGTGCPICSGNKKITKDEQERRIKESGCGRYSFVRWVNESKFGLNDRCIVRCDVDGYEWEAYVNNLVNKKRGCIKCRGLNSSKILRSNDIDVINEINNASNGGFSVVGFVDRYVNCYSFVECKCIKCNSHWSASVTHLKSSKSGCPRCALYGYQLTKKGYLYLLRSDDGLLCKIGISNNHKKRIKQLKLSTPFIFNVIEIFSDDSGEKIANIEKYFHKKYESAGFSGFDGATEWLKFSHELLEEFKNLSR